MTARIVVDIRQDNFLDVIYLKGDAVTEGSVRFIIDPVDSSLHLQERISSVWEDTRFLFGNDFGVVTEHKIYTNSLDHLLDNSFHPIYFG